MTTLRSGPVEFWTLPDLRLDRRLYTEDDQIVAGPLAQTREALLRRDGRLEIRIWETGELIATLPDLPTAREFRMVPGRRQVLLQVGKDLQLFDFDASEPRWTATQYSLQGFVVGDIVIARPIVRSGWGPAPAVTAIRIVDGQPDARFDQAGPGAQISLSKNGRFASIRSGQGICSVCDAATGALIWRTPVPAHRDYWWLARWAVLPPVVVVVLLRLWARLRLRRARIS